MAKSVSARSGDLAPQIKKKVDGKSVVVAPDIRLELKFDVAEPGFEHLKKQDWVKPVLQKTQPHLDKFADALAGDIKRLHTELDKKAQGKREVEAGAAILKAAEARMPALKKACHDALRQYMKERKQSETHVLGCNVKLAVKSVVLLVGAVGAAVTASPLSAASPILASRAINGVLKAIHDRGRDLGKQEKEIQGQLDKLRRLLAERLAEAEKSPQAATALKTMKAVGLGAVSAILDAPTTSLGNCEKVIHQYKVSYVLLQGDLKKLLPAIKPALKAIQSLQQQLKQQRGNEKQAAVALKKLQDAFGAFAKLADQATALAKDIETAKRKHAAFEHAFAAIRDGVPGWAKIVDGVLTEGIDLGLGIGTATTIAEKGTSLLGELSGMLHDWGWDKKEAEAQKRS